MGVYAAAADGDRELALKELRNCLALAIEDASPRDLAPLSRQLSAVLREIDGIGNDAAVEIEDEVEAARKRRKGA